MVNCKTRQKKEWLKNSQLLRKEDRINRILAKMQSQQCTEEQMSEVYKYVFSIVSSNSIFNLIYLLIVAFSPFCRYKN